MVSNEDVLRDKKAEAVSTLLKVDFDAYDLDNTDRRLRLYLDGVRDNPDGHNVYEVLAVVRFFRMLDRYIFRPEKVKRFIRFYESVKFSGMKGRRCYKMTPVQVFQFANIYGFYRMEESMDGDDMEEVRLIQQAILFVPRKFSKTTSSASMVVYDLLTGDQNAQAYTAANSYKQAKICFDEIRKIVKQFDPNGKFFKVSREHIGWKRNKYGKESFAECLTGGADTKDGLNASLVIFDEYAAARYVKGHSDGAALLQVLTSSMGMRREPLTVIITTASRIQDGPFQMMLEGAKSVLRGEIEDDSMFALLFMPDAWEMDEESLGKPEVWYKCNPHLGVTVRPSYYESKWRKAKADPEEMLEFKSKMVNVFVADCTKEWISGEMARALSSDIRMSELRGRPDAMCSMDLSVSDDFSVVSYTIYSKIEKKFYTWCDFYIPEETLVNHPNARLYEYWVKGGYLNVCPGAVISEDMIVSDILKRNRQVRIVQIGYDAYKAKDVVNALASAIIGEGGDPERILRAVPQTYGAFTSPVEAFEMAAKMDRPKVVLANNPIIFYCFANAYLDEDRMGNKKPLKRKINLKIDAVIAILMNYWLFINTEQGIS